jgi:hypothetical protein
VSGIRIPHLAMEIALIAVSNSREPIQIQALNRRGRQLSYEIGSALHLQPSHTTESGGVVPLHTRATNIISKRLNRHTGDASPSPMGTGVCGGWVPVLTIRDRSLETAARPRKNAMAGARGYSTCNENGSIRP